MLPPPLSEVGVSTPVSDPLDQQDEVREPGETEATINLPRNITRSKDEARKSSEEIEQRDTPREPGETETTLQLPYQRARQSRASSSNPDDAESTIRLPHKIIKQLNERSQSLAASTRKLPFMRRNARANLEQDVLESFGETAQENQDDEVMAHHETWQRVVAHKTTNPTLAVSAQTKRGPSWFAVLSKRGTARSFFWLCALIAIALLLSGAFGLAASFGRTVQKAIPHPSPTLLASPATIALGDIVTMRGTYFTPGGNVALSRDAHIPLVDTSEASTIQADAHGLFSDTFVVAPVWLSGAHTLYATDTRTHKQALFPLLVTGHSALQGPPHLLFSASTLDLGSGDGITNASKMLALSNAGGGVATWQASVSQTWLQITPQNGSIASGKSLSVIVAATRADLAPASYQANIVFISNTGRVTLTVSMTVTYLQPGHQAILELSSATLAFNGLPVGKRRVSRRSRSAILVFCP